MRAAVIRNPRSHRHRQGDFNGHGPDGVQVAAPTSRDALVADLTRFAREEIGLLVIDGGDGTIREVLSAMPAAFETLPLVAIVPSGKTNILALDLGVPKDWTVQAVLAAAAAGRSEIRTPLELRHEGAVMRGFFFGAAGFVHVIERAQRLHKAGMFHEAVVGLGLASSILSLFTGRGHSLREGEPLELRIDDGAARGGARLATIATTLQRLPFGMRPFGAPRPGLKILDVDAPPRHLIRALRRLLGGNDDAWLAAKGYRRSHARRATLSLSSAFVFDGETYAGGEVELREGPPLRFVVP
jgi:diacylglycerol kinase (ATP)